MQFGQGGLRTARRPRPPAPSSGEGAEHRTPLAGRPGRAGGRPPPWGRAQEQRGLQAQGRHGAASSRVVGTAGVTPVSANLGAWGVTGPLWFSFAGSAVILALGRHRLDQPPHEYGL